MKPINVVPGRSKYLGKQVYLGLGEGTKGQREPKVNVKQIYEPKMENNC